jgi:hypothetical protein
VTGLDKLQDIIRTFEPGEPVEGVVARCVVVRRRVVGRPSYSERVGGVVVDEPLLGRMTCECMRDHIQKIDQKDRSSASIFKSALAC